MQAIATNNAASEPRTLSANKEYESGIRVRRDPIGASEPDVHRTSIQKRSKEIEIKATPKSKGNGNNTGVGKSKGTGTAGAKPKNCKGIVKKPEQAKGGKVAGKGSGKKVKRVKQVYTDFLMPKRAQATPTDFSTVKI